MHCLAKTTLEDGIGVSFEGQNGRADQLIFGSPIEHPGSDELLDEQGALDVLVDLSEDRLHALIVKFGAGLVKRNCICLVVHQEAYIVLYQGGFYLLIGGLRCSERSVVEHNDKSADRVSLLDLCGLPGHTFVIDLWAA